LFLFKKMIRNFVITGLLKEFRFKPTQGQQVLIEILADFIINNKHGELLLIKGYAGTGKTSLIAAFVKAIIKMSRKVVLLAPTGRAAKVFALYSGIPAYTIHKEIYRQVSTKDGLGRFVLDTNLRTNTIFIVDEASMISNTSAEFAYFGSGRLLDDLIEYVYTGKNCKLIAVGDTAQLPPVGLAISPALDAKVLGDYFLDVIQTELTEVVRQASESGILYNATKLRNMLPNGAGYPQILLTGFNDLQRIITGELLELISSSYDKYGIQDTIVVCRSNKRANRYNQGIRQRILYREEEIANSDYLMVVRNNYFWLNESDKTDFIANGDIIQITNIRNYEEMYGFRFANVTLQLVDYEDREIDAKILLDTLNSESASLTQAEMQKFYLAVAEDYLELPHKQKLKKIKENPYFNALQVKFAYSVTCHKAQGGQWKSVFIDPEYYFDKGPDTEYLRWLYTAFTRAMHELYLVNFKDTFIESVD